MSSSKPSAAASAFARQFTGFVDGSPTPFHCVAQTVSRLESVGFVRLREEVAWKGTVVRGGKYYYTRNGSTIVAFAVGGRFEAGNGFKVIGAHTDSPALKVKPISRREKSGLLQVGVECYGGGLWHTWFDRDLGVAGRAIVRTSADHFEQRLVHIKKPILRVPNLAIHLQTGPERAAFKVNKEDHLTPVLGILEQTLNASAFSASKEPASGASASASASASTSGDGDGKLDERHAPAFLATLAADMKVSAEDIVDLELTLTDTQPATLGGLDEAFIFSPRLDNQMHCYTSVEALATFCADEDGATLQADEGISLVVLFDHEEVGSQSAVGAGSPVMRDAVERVSFCFMDAANEETFRIGLTKSMLLSADGAHAVHPNYSGKHEAKHGPVMNGGTVVKTNDNQRYATNAVTGFFVRELARRHGLPIQEFVVRNDCPCGSTIGPIIAANVGIRTVDIGVSQLSMHSIREQCAVEDLHQNYVLLAAFFKHATDVDACLTGL